MFVTETNHQEMNVKTQIKTIKMGKKILEKIKRVLNYRSTKPSE